MLKLCTQSRAGNNELGLDFRVGDPHEKTKFADLRPSLSLRPVASTTGSTGRSVALDSPDLAYLQPEILLNSQTRRARVW